MYFEEIKKKLALKGSDKGVIQHFSGRAFQRPFQISIHRTFCNMLRNHRAHDDEDLTPTNILALAGRRYRTWVDEVSVYALISIITYFVNPSEPH